MKNFTKITFVLTTVFIMSISTVNSQNMIDGFFNKKGDLKVSLSYTFATFDEFYVGGNKTGPVPAHNEINQTIYSLFGNYAISDNLMIIANVPYISTEGDGDPDPVNGSTEQKDLQDISVYVKWAPYIQTLDHGSMTYVLALGGSFATGYEPNGILSIGNGAPSIEGKAGLQYKNNCGFFGTLMAGYTVRGEANNNFNLGDGSKFNSANSYNTLIKLGYAASKIYGDIWYDSQTSTDGVDIAGAGFFGNFPETRVNYSRVGANIFFPFTEKIGVSVGAGAVVDGRNLGDTTFYSGGLTLSL